MKGAASDELETAIGEHLEVTKGQLERLDQVFATLDKTPKSKHCKGMERLLKEGSDCLEEEDKGELRDLALIGAAQRVEHYEVAAYGNSKAIAEQLGRTEAAELLGETLTEEEEAATKLTEVAQGLDGEVETGNDDGETDEDEVEDDEAVAATAAPAKLVQ